MSEEIFFKEEGHEYNGADKNWTSVTSLLGQYHEEFDKWEMAMYCSKNKRNPKYYGMSPKSIVEMWDNENKRATDLGHKYHYARESELVSSEEINGLKVFSCPMDGDKKIALPQTDLQDGIYPEFIAYLKRFEVIGQIDYLEIRDKKVYINDYKTNKELKWKSYVNYLGESKMMFAPINHIEDCNAKHYNLQLSIYMFMILRQNPHLSFGGIKIQYVTFKEIKKDENGYPVNEFDENGNPIVKDVVYHELPYMEHEVKLLLNDKKDKDIYGSTF